MTSEEREAVLEHAKTVVERRELPVVARPTPGSTKRELQLELLRTAIGCICAIGDVEPQDHLTAVSTLALRALTPLRNMERKLVHDIERQVISTHVQSGTPTPGMAIR